MTPSSSQKPSPPATLDLAPAWLAEVRAILGRVVPGAEVRAFGSRVTGKAVAASDLDLAVFDAGPLSFRRLRELEESFEESDLPVRVDVVDGARLSPAFLQIVDRASVVVQSLTPGPPRLQSPG